MKIVIIEDEKAAVRNLTSLLNEIKPNGEIVTILDSISSTIEWFSSHPMPELVFMDIHLADGYRCRTDVSGTHISHIR